MSCKVSLIYSFSLHSIPSSLKQWRQPLSAFRTDWLWLVWASNSLIAKGLEIQTGEQGMAVQNWYSYLHSLQMAWKNFENDDSSLKVSWFSWGRVPFNALHFCFRPHPKGIQTFWTTVKITVFFKMAGL